MEILALQWGDSKRPDGTTRHWNPAPLINLKATLVCVAYRPLTNNERWYSVGMTPPKLLAQTLSNTLPELNECHQHGIKVVGYADTIMFHPDMMAAEGINADDLYAINRKGERVVNKMWDKSGAGVSCIMNPTWVELQKEVALVTARAGFDGLQFDVYPYAIEPGYLCCCPHCKTAWASHSKRVFGTAQPFPGLNSGKLDFRIAVDREFKTWRLDQFSDFVKAVESAVRKSYPDFIIIMNHGAGTPDYTSEAVAGALKYPSTELWHLKLGDDSSLYLYSSTEAACGGKAIGLINFADQYAPPYRYRVALAEAFASGGTFYAVVQQRQESEAGKISHDYGDFFRDHAEWYNDTKSEAAVAVLYSWRDQAFLEGNPVTEAKVEFDPKRNAYQRAAAVLSRLGVPHDCLIVEKGMSEHELSRYQVIVVPELSLLTDKEAGALEKYVRKGGRLLVIGRMGTVTEKKQDLKERTKPLLATWAKQELESGAVATMGKGLIAFAARSTTDEVIGTPPPPVDPGDAIAEIKKGPMAIPLKRLSPEFISACNSVGLSSQLKIESSSDVETAIRGKGLMRAIHLIRFGPTAGVTNKPVTVEYRLPNGFVASSISAWSPDIPASSFSHAWKPIGDRVQIKINQLDSYVLIGAILEPAK